MNGADRAGIVGVVLFAAGMGPGWNLILPGLFFIALSVYREHREVKQASADRRSREAAQTRKGTVI